MSSNQQFSANQQDQFVQPDQSVSVDSAQPEHSDPGQADSVDGATDIAPVRLPTMADLDSLAESLDQVDQTLAELDHAQVAS